jgi:CheY-like chemotaxis protein
MANHPDILLVEDDANDAELTLTALEDIRIGNAVVHVSDGEAALDYLFRRRAFDRRPPRHPAVVLLDLKLPRIDGFEVLRTIKGNPRLRAIPVVVLTSSKEEQDLVRCYDLGVNAFVVKPIVFSEFSTAVARLGVFWAVLNEPPPLATGGG